MRKFSPGMEELGKSISRLEERRQHGNDPGSRHTSRRPLLHLTGFYLIHQLTSNTKQISFQIAQALMWKWALHLAYNYGRDLQFYYLLFKDPQRQKLSKTLGLVFKNDTCYIKERETSKVHVFCPETPHQPLPWVLHGFTGYLVVFHKFKTMPQSQLCNHWRSYVSHFFFQGNSLLPLSLRKMQKKKNTFFQKQHSI